MSIHMPAACAHHALWFGSLMNLCAGRELCTLALLHLSTVTSSVCNVLCILLGYVCGENLLFSFVPDFPFVCLGGCMHSCMCRCASTYV